MAQYIRRFIMLKIDKPGYGINGRMPTGRCILETRGNISKIVMQVQDLKANILYKTYIIVVDEKSSYGMPIGNMVVDERGKGEFKKEISSEELEGKGIAIKNVNVVALVVGDEVGNSPLVGYLDEEISWRFNFKDISKVEKTVNETKQEEDEYNDLVIEEEIVTEEEIYLQNVEESTEEELEALFQKEEKVVQIDHTEDIEAVETSLDTEKVDAKEEKLLENNQETQPKHEKIIEEEQFAKASDFFENMEAEQKEEIIETFKTMSKNLMNEINELEYFNVISEGKPKDKLEESEYLVETTNENSKIESEIDFLFLNNIEIKPFKSQRKKIKWVRISLKELAILPIDFWEFMNHPLIISSYKKNNHLILGMEEKDDVQYYLGVPCTYEKGNKLRANELGFKQFKCCNSARVTDGELGYWLLKI